MQQVTISGNLLNDAEKCRDKNGNLYSRFDVTCPDTNYAGRTTYTHYHCVCYLAGVEMLKKGDQVFLTGKLNATASVDSKGNAYVNLNIMVFQATVGSKLEDRKKQ